MSIDWDKIESESFATGGFKPFVEDGDYAVKASGIEVVERGTNGNYVMKFKFEEEEDAQYPSADHWLAWKNDNFRCYHNRNLMMVLGATKEQAEKAVETCEAKKDHSAIASAYTQMFERLLAKKPTVEIEVYTQRASNGKDYARAEFKDRSVNMGHDDETTSKPVEKKEDVLEGAEEVKAGDLDLDSLPF